jgi:hypothetical protein
MIPDRPTPLGIMGLKRVIQTGLEKIRECGYKEILFHKRQVAPHGPFRALSSHPS